MSSECKGGIHGGGGYDYQKMVAIHYLVVGEISEIEYESGGEDILIMNEDKDKNSIEYVQVKSTISPSYSMYTYKKDIIPKFWEDYDESLHRYGEKKSIYCRLITNVSCDKKLKKFMELCKDLRENRITLSDFDRYIGEIDLTLTELESCTGLILNDKKDFENEIEKRDKFERFLKGLKMKNTFVFNLVKLEIINYMYECNIRDPDMMLSKILLYVTELIVDLRDNKKRTGIITRNKIREIVGKDLIRSKTISQDQKTISQDQKSEINPSRTEASDYKKFINVTLVGSQKKTKIEDRIDQDSYLSEPQDNEEKTLRRKNICIGGTNIDNVIIHLDENGKLYIQYDEY